MEGSSHKLRVGVIGAGTMGQHHVRVVSQTPGVTLVGFHDPDRERSGEICLRHDCACFDRLEDLLDKVDAVSIAAPTSLHLEIGTQCLARGLHVMMEKPLAHDAASAALLVDKAREAGVVLMVGHIEAYNPAVTSLMEVLRAQPERIVSIDCRRLSPFDGSRCMDVDVLHDLLIHDMDLALEIADSPLRLVSATGRPVYSQQTDVAHVRLEFENGTVAVFWTAKCSPRKVRTLTVATPSRYMVADTLERSLAVFSASEIPSVDEGLCTMGEIRSESIPLSDEEPLRRELEDFFKAVRENSPPLVGGDRALRALQALEHVARAIAEARTIELPLKN
jgi:predicted dehydrogenase